MVCQNSKPGSKWWKNKICHNWSRVDNVTAAVLCWKCTTMLIEGPVQKSSEKDHRPKGWRRLKEFIDTDGTVYFKGVEQPHLKGTLPATVIQPIVKKEPAKKLTRKEREDLAQTLGEEISKLKAALFSEKSKTKRTELTLALKKANRELKKTL